jgi:hypothetical protein
MNLFRNESSHPLDNAQKNLMGRTHYVDPDTLKWHKSRVLSSGMTDGGLLFWIVTSDALDMDNTRRGYRFVVFDVFGHVVSRQKLEDAWKRREPCDKAKLAFLNRFDAVTHTRQAIHEARENYLSELLTLGSSVDAIATKIGHHKAA